MDNILPQSAWAVVRPASKNYLHQPAYHIMHWSIRRTRCEAIRAYMSIWRWPDFNKWRRFKRKGFKCIRVNILSSQKASQLYMQELNVQGNTKNG